MAADVTILAALLAGLVSFLSPCVLPLVPPYLVYLAGTSLERLAEAEPPPRVRRDTVIAAVLFVLGFSTVFVTLGASASAIGALMRFYSNELAIIAGITIIVMGLHFLGLTPIGLLHRQARFHVAKPVGLWGAYVMGLAFALGWTPCIGGHGRQGCGPARGLFARARRAVRHRCVRGRAICRVSGALSRPSCPRRAGDGRLARAHRHRVSHWCVHAIEQLADRNLPGAADHRLSTG
jgi:Cytochrome C biogenesis protein transmembrane region